MTAEEKYPVLIGHYSGGRRRLHGLVEVADFITWHGRREDLLITLRDWSPFMDTCGMYIDFAADPEYREELMKVLAPMQVECERLDAMVELLDGAEKPLNIKNLAELKRTIKPGVEIKATSHANHPDIVGLVRVVTEVQSNAFYSKIKGQPDHPYSNCNHGQGFRTDFGKASNYSFDGTSIKVSNSKGQQIYELEVYPPAMSVAEAEEEVKKMNDWNSLRRQAQRYKDSYPPGTRVMLIDMKDPYAPVPSGTRGTVELVDDIGQIHMKWDNGRSLAIVPGEDSFRRLTDKEVLAEENAAFVEPEDGPTLGM